MCAWSGLNIYISEGERKSSEEECLGNIVITLDRKPPAAHHFMIHYAHTSKDFKRWNYSSRSLNARTLFSSVYPSG